MATCIWASYNDDERLQFETVRFESPETKSKIKWRFTKTNMTSSKFVSKIPLWLHSNSQVTIEAPLTVKQICLLLRHASDLLAIMKMKETTTKLKHLFFNSGNFTNPHIIWLLASKKDKTNYPRLKLIKQVPSFSFLQT